MLQEVKTNIDKARPDFIYGKLTLLTSEGNIDTIANTLASSEYALPILTGEEASDVNKECVAVVNRMHLIVRFAQPKESERDSIEAVILEPLSHNPETKNAIVSFEFVKNEIQNGLALWYRGDGVINSLEFYSKFGELSKEDNQAVLALARIVKEHADYQFEELSEEAAQYEKRVDGEYSFEQMREFTLRYNNMRPEDLDAMAEAEVRVTESDLNSITGDNTQS